MCVRDRGVLRQTKRLVNALKELRTAVRGSRASLEAAARKVSEYLLFFLEIGEAAVLDEPAQVRLRLVCPIKPCDVTLVLKL